MICRNEERTEAARQNIIEDIGNTGIEIILAVLAVQHDVCSAAQQIRLRKNSTTTAYKLHPGVIGTQLAEEAGGAGKTFLLAGKTLYAIAKVGDRDTYLPGNI